MLIIEIDDSLKSKVDELISRGVEVGKKETHTTEGPYRITYVSGPMYDKWMGEIKIFNERHLGNHPLHDSINTTYIHRKNKQSSYNDMMGHLRALSEDEEFLEQTSRVEKKDGLITNDSEAQMLVNDKDKNNMCNKVFIVHGHDNEAKQEMARTLEKAGFEVIILHEQADSGLTIIEKIEKYTDVAFAVVLYTKCDLGREKEADINSEKYRARQNVVFEHGYLIGKLGRGKVCAVVKGDVETPGDINGVVYTPMDPDGAWKMQLGKNMKDAGLNVDLDKLCI